MRRIAALSVLSLVAMAGCKSTDDETTSSESAVANTVDSTETTGANESTDFVSDDTRAPGVTDDTIKVGITYLDFTEEVRQQIKTWHGDYQAMYQALADAVNANGGIHGRELELVFAPIPTSVDGADDAACTKLTEDDPVFVVTGYISGGDAAMCYVDTHETPLIGGGQTAELRSQAKVAWFTTDLGADAELGGIAGLVQNDDLTGKVAVVGTTGDQALYEASIAPALEEAGVEVVDTALLDLASNTDTTVQEGLTDTAIERIRGAEVDTVLLIGQGAAPLFLQQLSKTDWRPTIRASIANGVNIFAGNAAADRSVLEGSRIYGTIDPADTYLEMTDEATKYCVDTLTAGGITLVPKTGWTFESGNGKTWVGAAVSCSNMALLVAMLEKAGPNLDFGTFRHAGETLGAIYVFGDTNPRTYGPGDGADGNPVLHPYDWDAAQLKYVLAE